MAHPAARAHRDAIGGATVGFHEDEQPLAVDLGEPYVKQSPGQEAHPDAEHLARAKMFVQACRLIEECFELRTRGRLDTVNHCGSPFLPAVRPAHPSAEHAVGDLRIQERPTIFSVSGSMSMSK